MTLRKHPTEKIGGVYGREVHIAQPVLCAPGQSNVYVFEYECNAAF